MLANVQFAWAADGVIKKLSRDDYARLREGIPQLELGEWPEDKEAPPAFWVWTASS